MKYKSIHQLGEVCDRIMDNAAKVGENAYNEAAAGRMTFTQADRISTDALNKGLADCKAERDIYHAEWSAYYASL